MKKSKTIAGLCLSAAIVLGQLSAAAAVSAEADVTTDPVPAAPTGETVEELLDSGRDYAEDQLIVTFEDSTSDQKIEQIVENQDASCEDITALTDEKIAQVTIAQEDTLEDALQKFQEDSRVVAVQPNYRYTRNKEADKPDPFLNASAQGGMYQYHLKTIRAEAAWTLLEKGKHGKTRVAVIDTGVDPSHEDLQRNLVKDKKGGYIRAINGALTHSMDDSDMEDGHGTHVTGIIGATYHNGKGGSGVASGHKNNLVEVMTVGASEDGYGLYTADIVAAINYAAKNGAKVVNMSFGGPGRDRVMEQAIKNAYYNKGIVFAAASGNDSSSEFSSPGDFREVIDINASDMKNNTSVYWSDFGVSKDVTAPGADIISASPGDRYVSMSGTSMASPVAAGIIALIRDARPDLTPAQVYNILCGTTNQTAFRPGTTAFGIINAEKAVKAAQSASADIPAKELYLKESRITLFTGDDYCLEYLVRPATSLQPVTWSSSNPKVAKVDKYGRVTGLRGGIVKVTAKAGSLKKVCTVTVVPSVRAKSITILGKPYRNELTLSGSAELSVRIKPTTASNQEVYWTSSNSKVARISEYGSLTPQKVGETVITAKTYDGKVKDSFRLKVKYAPAKVTLTRKTRWIQMGSTFQFKAKVTDPKGGTNIVYSPVTWRSNRKIASVSKTGLVTPKKPGNVYIRAEVSGEDRTLVAYQQLIVAKKNYAGADYALKQSARSKKSVTLSWKKIPIASGYQVQRAPKKGGKFKTVATIKKGATVKYKVKTKKNAYYRVRAYYYKHGAKKPSYFSYSRTILAKVATKKK